MDALIAEAHVAAEFKRGHPIRHAAFDGVSLIEILVGFLAQLVRFLDGEDALVHQFVDQGIRRLRVGVNGRSRYRQGDEREGFPKLCSHYGRWVVVSNIGTSGACDRRVTVGWRDCYVWVTGLAGCRVTARFPLRGPPS